MSPLQPEWAGDLAGGDLTGRFPDPQIAAGAVAAAELAAGAVGSGKIAAGAVGSSEIADGSVTDADLATPGMHSPTAVTQPARVVSTVYQPSTTRPALIIVRFDGQVGANGDLLSAVLIGATNNPTTEVARWEVGSANGVSPPSITSGTTCTLLLPAGWFYKITGAAGALAGVTEILL